MKSNLKFNYYSNHLRNDDAGNFYCLFHPSQKASFMIDGNNFDFECSDCGIKGTINDFVKIIEPETNVNRFNN
ncbi:MAG: hypothetical protein ACOVP4_05365 [Bacteriovoracaceae bacterium]